MIDPTDHIGLVCRVAKQFTSEKPIEDTEEYGDGIIGLMTAIRQFDPDRGFQFSTFAWRCVRSSIIAGYRRKRTRNNVVPRFATVDVETLASPKDINEAIDTRDLIATMRKSVSKLPLKERKVISSRLSGKKLREISADIGLTKQRVQQIELSATGMLRVLMAEAGAIG